MAAYSSMLAWISHGQRSLAGYSPEGCKESDVTEANTHTHTHTHTQTATRWQQVAIVTAANKDLP